MENSNTTRPAVLLVEDDDSIRDYLATILTAFGCNVIRAATFDEAVKLWKVHESEISMILTDVVLPGDSSGVDLVRYVRKHRDGIPAILSTGLDYETFERLFPDLKAVHFLPKPFPTAALKQIVDSIIQNSATASDST